MATKKASLVRVDEDYIDMLMSPYATNEMATKKASLVRVDEDYIDMLLSPYATNEMATKKASLVRVDEDYIDMLISPYANLSHLIGSPPQQNREIEFHNGKKHHLLPKLPYNTNAPFGFVRSNSSLENSSFPYHTTDASASDQSRRFSSCDTNPSEFQFHRDLPKVHWSKKLKHTKSYFWFGQRVNSFIAYIKSLFTKTANCSADKSSVIAANNNVAEKVNKPKCKDFCDEPKINVFENGFANYRGRGSIQRHCVTKASSLSIPSSRSSSSCSSFSGVAKNYEMEGSIAEAIAHCKQSQMQRNGSNKAPHDDKACSNFASKVAFSGN